MVKVVYKPGDIIEIVNPRRIIRIGYPLTMDDVKSQVEDSLGFKQALKALGCHSKGRAYRKLLEAACFNEVAVRGFGGRERSSYGFYPFGGESLVWWRPQLEYA